MIIRYLVNLSTGRLFLWCYFIWYAVVLARYFDASPRLWLTSLGLSLIIGFALFISTARAGTQRLQLDRWQVFRLFLMPFCVSSFSASVKGRGFVLIFPPNPVEILAALCLCALLGLTVLRLKRRAQNRLTI
jgi:asparagine N-glycosylation enzyme membrane subunit Stt3